MATAEETTTRVGKKHTFDAVFKLKMIAWQPMIIVLCYNSQLLAYYWSPYMFVYIVASHNALNFHLALPCGVQPLPQIVSTLLPLYPGYPGSD